MLEAVFITGVDEVTVVGLTQWDRGQTVQITCPDLPAEFQVHFANRKSKKAIVTQATSENGIATVVIPDELLREPFEVFAYLYLGEDFVGETTRTVRMPVERRRKPDDYIIVLPQEQATDAEKIVMKLMDEYIAENVEASISATQARTDALAAQAAAETARDEAVDAQRAIEDLTVEAVTLKAVEDASVEKTVDNGKTNLRFGLPRGEQGLAGTLEIVEVEMLASNATPAATETEDSTREIRKYKLSIPTGLQGEPFTYEDFTPEQLTTLKGEPGKAGNGIKSITIQEVS